MDEQSWKALARIAASPDGKSLLDILKQRREDCRDKLEKALEPEHFHKLQGSANAIKDLIDNLSEAHKVVESRSK